ncbi:hypothetical protein FRC19_009533 [Serendipita sp. 401]|nr:hypothetical protein FRC19_009533 [Serendipita sp. 401]KAG8867120.1 hypothetical protein FRC20_006695 [Serendipita sp. 405]
MSRIKRGLTIGFHRWRWKDHNRGSLCNVGSMEMKALSYLQELGAAMRSLGLKPSDKELDFMVKQVDVDGNGTIDFNEFLVLMAQKIKDGEILQAFKVFDENGDGYISKQELASVMTKLGQRLSDKEVDQMMEAADTNEDGKINYIGQYLHSRPPLFFQI